MARSGVARVGITVAATAACLTGFATALAQNSDDITIEIGDCVGLESPDARRDCYAARVDAAVQERERSAATGEPENRSASVGETARQQSGTRERSDDTRAEVVSGIAELRETVPNSFLITLDNGQVWRQMEPKWFPLRVGQVVRIFPSSWGNTFRLSVQDLSGYIQVERVR